MRKTQVSRSLDPVGGIKGEKEITVTADDKEYPEGVYVEIGTVGSGAIKYTDVYDNVNDRSGMAAGDTIIRCTLPVLIKKVHGSGDVTSIGTYWIGMP